MIKAYLGSAVGGKIGFYVIWLGKTTPFNYLEIIKFEIS